jgi:deazaflavin-dependent oxidoreductase (nitroreductase family)
MTETVATEQPARPIPHWVIRTIWKAHRALYRISGGRLGLRTPTDTRWGMLELTTIGRRSGKRRAAILGYIEDGAGNLGIPAMNGWMDPEPAWWLNLQTDSSATVVLPGGERRTVTARAAAGEERERLWRSLVDLGTAAYTDANASVRSRETSIVVFEPAG